MIKVKLIYKELGWISLYDHEYRNFVLTYRESKEILVPENKLNYYENLGRLGLEVIIDRPNVQEVEQLVEQVVEELPVEELPVEELPVEELVQEKEPELDEVKKLSKAELKQLLDSLDIEYKSSDTKAELLEKLGAHYDRG